MTLQQAFSRNMTNMLCEHDVSITELSQEIGLSRANLYRVMSGRGLPNLYTAWKIAEYFCCGIDELIEGVDENDSN